MTFFEKMTRSGKKIARNMSAAFGLVMSLAFTADSGGIPPKPEKDKAHLVNINAMSKLVQANYGDEYVYGQDMKLDMIVDTATTSRGMQKAVRKVKGKKLSARKIFKKTMARQMNEALYETAYQNVRKDIKLDTLMSMQFSSPLHGGLDELTINSPYGPRNMNGSHFHKGTDLHATAGTAVFCPVDDAVVVSSCVFKGSNIGMVELDIGNGFHVRLLHVKVIEGKQHFKRGEQITTVAPHNYYGPERSTAPHLHFEVLENGKQINSTDIINDDGLLVDIRKSPLAEKAGNFASGETQKDATYAEFIQTKNDLQQERKTSRITKSAYRRNMRGMRVIQQTVENQAYQAFAVQLNTNAHDVTVAMNNIDAMKKFRGNHLAMVKTPANQNLWRVSSSFGPAPLQYSVL